MRYTLADASESPWILTVVALGVVAAATAVLVGGTKWGVQDGSTGWLIAVLLAAIAALVTIASWLPSS